MLLANVITSAVVAITAPDSLTISKDAAGYYIADDMSSNGVRRVEIINSEQYAILTGRLDKVWSANHKDTQSRERIHGKRIKTLVDENLLLKSEVYADGYIHTEKLKKVSKKEKESRALSRGIRNPPKRVRPSTMSARQWKKKLKSETKTNKTVTVEFAPGGIPVKEIK